MRNTVTRITITALIAVICIAAGLLPSFAYASAGQGNAAGAEAEKTLIMGTSADFPPFESVDAKNGGQFVGLDIDIASYMTEQLGYKLEIVNMDFNGLIAALQTGRVDFVMSGMSATDERRESVDFSDIYYSARNSIISKIENSYSSADQLNGKLVGVQLGTTQDFFAETIEGVSLTKLNKIPDLIQELNTGRVDALIVEDAVAIEAVNANPGLTVEFLPSDKDENGYAIAFPKNSDIRDEFNQVLNQMASSGQLDELINKWFPVQEEPQEAIRGFHLDFSILKEYIPYILRGIYVTLLFTLVSALFGFIWGTILSFFKLSRIKPLQWFATAYTSVFRGTPLLLQLLLIYFATPQLFNYDISPLMAAGLAFGLNSAAYLSETIRGGIMAVDKGQMEAAMALGISHRTAMIKIILPQAVRSILPALVNECIALLKESSLVSVIGVQDLMRRASVVQSLEFRAFEPLLFAGAIYYVLVLVLTSIARLLERRMRRSD